ncbi:hypothetical protein C8R46DRAFT_278888 [Mycena filopes]|nr:hypothetical protein C8R46DRAFT_278888 [Mycena filopes]
MAYPVLTLPFDVISQIFVYCLPPEEDALPWRTEAPLLLAGICREWRDVALATHDLWNTMHLNLRPHSVPKVDRLLDFWIPRAGNLPLSMSLVFKIGNTETSRVDSLDRLIGRYSRRWTSIELHMPMSELLQLTPPVEQFVSLYNVVLDCGRLEGGIRPRVATTFLDSPKLRDVHVFSNTVSRVVFPWGQLTTLRLDITTVGDCLKALRDVPNLVHLTASLWSEGIPPHSVSLLRLETLKLPLSHNRGPELLQYLTLPALQRLELDLQGQRQITYCISFLIRSACLLRQLSVRFGALWTTYDFARLFLALDSLEGLQVGKATRSLDAAFALLKDEPRMLPNLTSMSVERTMVDDENPALLAGFLHSRWNVAAGVSLPAQLKSFRLDSPLAPPVADGQEEFVHRLARLLVAGMDLRITSSHESWFYLPPERRFILAQENEDA